jgi:TonB-dependent starch-binding outer membrane protein SusC
MKRNLYHSAIFRLSLVVSLSGIIQFCTYAQGLRFLTKNSNNTPLPESKQILDILKELEVKYNVFFTFKDKTLKGKIVPQNLRKSGKLEVILDFLLKSQNIEYKKVGNIFYLYSPEELAETKIKNSLLIDGKPMNDGMMDKENFNTKLFTNKEIKPLLETFIPIKGNVVSENGEPMPGVSIRLKGTPNGTSSDLNGHYALSASEKYDNAVLLFSMIGYKTTEIALRGRSAVNVTLSPEIKSLGEVVVVGYGTQQRKDLTGSVTSISMEDLKNIPITGIDQAMQGKVSGVIVNNNSGQPGASVSVRIRGITSVTSSNEPLYVIDGIPFSGDGGATRSQNFDEFGGGGGQTHQSVLASLNPNDIATIDILKDASATAIYGARASNGVVIITTKRGKMNESKVSYDSYFGFQEVCKKLDVLNLQEYAEYQNQVRKENNLSPIPEFANTQILGNGTNWQDEIFRKGAIQSHQLSFSGGKDKTQFYISGGYFKQDGIVVGSNFDRYSVRVNLDNQVKKWLKIGNSFSLSRTNQRTILTDTDDGVISGAILQAPSVPVHLPDGAWGGAEDQLAFFAINPVALAIQKDVTRTQTRFNGNFWADLTLFDGLSFRGEIGGDMSFTKNSAFNPTYKWGVTENTQSKYIRREEQLSYWNAKAFLNYNKVFANLHRLSVMVGHEAQYSFYEALNSVAIGLTSNEIQSLNLGDPKLSSTQDKKYPWAMESFLSRVNYNYDDRFNLTLTYRLDGSSNFGPNKRWGQFPSVAAAWTISKEAFMKDVVAFSNLKIRAGYGAVGNQQLPSYSYGALLKSVGTSFGNGYYVDKIPNPNLQWEAAQQTNIGLDLGLFKNRFNLSLDVYKKVSNNFLLQASLPTFTGAGQNWDDVKAPFINAGEMQNTGIDITLNTNNVNSQCFKWNTNLVFSHYKNQINALVSQNDAYYERLQWYDNITKTAVGSSVGMFYGYNTKGIFQNVEQIKNSPSQSKDGKINERSGTFPGDIIFADNNGDGQVDGYDRVYIGSPHPDFTFGVTNTFNYKNFDLSVFIQGSQGAKVFNFIRFRTEGMNELFPNQLKTITDRWTPENPSGKLPRFILGDPNDNRRASDRFIEDGSYVRIQNISFGYTLPTGLLDKAFIKKLKVYGSLQNLYTFTKYSGYDPEIGSFNQNSKLSNVDNGHYPMPRTFTLGVNVEF